MSMRGNTRAVKSETHSQMDTGPSPLIYPYIFIMNNKTGLTVGTGKHYIRLQYIFINTSRCFLCCIHQGRRSCSTGQIRDRTGFWLSQPTPRWIFVCHTGAQDGVTKIAIRLELTCASGTLHDIGSRKPLLRIYRHIT